jgi:hypothetical protein
MHRGSLQETTVCNVFAILLTDYLLLEKKNEWKVTQPIEAIKAIQFSLILFINFNVVFKFCDISLVSNIR